MDSLFTWFWSWSTALPNSPAITSLLFRSSSIHLIVIHVSSFLDPIRNCLIISCSALQTTRLSKEFLFSWSASQMSRLFKRVFSLFSIMGFPSILLLVLFTLNFPSSFVSNFFSASIYKIYALNPKNCKVFSLSSLCSLFNIF